MKIKLWHVIVAYGLIGYTIARLLYSYPASLVLHRLFDFYIFPGLPIAAFVAYIVSKIEEERGDS